MQRRRLETNRNVVRSKGIRILGAFGQTTERMPVNLPRFSNRETAAYKKQGKLHKTNADPAPPSVDGAERTVTAALTIALEKDRNPAEVSDGCRGKLQQVGGNRE